MDRSRSPRNLSDEARFLQRLAEPELPPGASDAERAAARAEAAFALLRCSSIASAKTFSAPSLSPSLAVAIPSRWSSVARLRSPASPVSVISGSASSIFAFAAAHRSALSSPSHASTSRLHSVAVASRAS